MVDTLVGDPDDEPGTGPSAMETGNRRPAGVTVLAVLFAIGAVILFLTAAAVVTTEGTAAPSLGTALFSLLFSLAGFAVAYGLWVGRRWAWFGAVVLEVLAIFTALLTLLSGDVLGGFLGIVITALILWYLFKPDVQSWFGVSFPTPWHYGRPT